MVDLEPLMGLDDLSFVRELIERHVRYTESTLGARLLDEWTLMVRHILKVMPREYKRVLLAAARQQAAQTDAPESAEPAPLLQVANG
jgi:glutamate synthase domain-containing protein 3